MVKLRLFLKRQRCEGKRTEGAADFGFAGAFSRVSTCLWRFPPWARTLPLWRRRMGDLITTTTGGQAQGGVCYLLRRGGRDWAVGPDELGLGGCLLLYTIHKCVVSHRIVSQPLKPERSLPFV
jgi:hypothetical protein